MNCPHGNETLTSLVDGELSPDEARRLEAHAADCAACSVELAELRELRRVLQTWDRAETGAIRPSAAFQDRVVAAARPTAKGPAVKGPAGTRPAAAGNGSAQPQPRVLPGGVRAASHAPRRRIRLPLLFVASSAAAVLLIATGFFLGGSRPAETPNGGRPAIADVHAPGLLFEARSLAAAGDEIGARQCYLAVLSLDPTNREALAALGFAPAGERVPIVVPTIPSFGVDGINPEAFRPKRVAMAPSEDFQEGIRFEGSLFSPLALDDYQRFRALQYRLAADEVDRTTSGGVDRPTAPDRPHPVMAMVARMGPASDLPPLRHETLTVIAIIDPGLATARTDEGDAVAATVGGRPLITIAEAFDAGLVRVVDGGSNLAFLTNRSTDRDVFVPAGTVLVGGHQDRVTTRDVIVRAGRAEPTGVPVFCCEALRSTGSSRSFRAAPFLAGPGLRRLILVEGDQSLVWERIRIQLDKVDAKNRTQALSKGLGSKRVGRRLEVARAELMRLVDDPRVIGFIAADGERILGVDVFGSHDLFTRLAPTFLDSYVFDGLTDAAIGHTGLNPERVKRFLASAAAGTLRERRGVDGGMDATIGLAEGVFGYAMVDDGARPVHVSLLPIPHAATAPDRPKGDGSTGGSDGDGEKKPDERGGGSDDRFRDRRPGLDRRPRPTPPGNPGDPGPGPGGGAGRGGSGAGVDRPGSDVPAGGRGGDGGR